MARGRKAFLRLQEAILASSDDESILLWEGRHRSPLAEGPSAFSGANDVIPYIGNWRDDGFQ
jgi:hypothetical protein